MLLKFKKARWKNLLSYGNYWTEIDLSSHKTTLIVGKNGDGKSTFIDALSFVLFNKPYRSIKKGQLVNSILNKGTLVEVEFERGEHEYMVRRGIKPNVFEIYKNGELVKQDSDSKDYQEYLERVLGLTPKSFPHVIVLGSANYVPFMRLFASDRRNVIEDLLDIQVFSKMNVLLKDRIKVWKVKYNEAVDVLQNTRDQLSMIEEHNEKIRENNNAVIDEKENEIEQYSEESLTILKDIKKLKKKLSALVVEDAPDYMSEIREYEREQASIRKEISMKKRTLSFLDENDTCPTCKQTIDKHFKGVEFECGEKEIGELSTRVTYLDEQIAKLQEKLDAHEEVEKEVKQFEKEIGKKQNAVETNKRLITSLLKDIEALKIKEDEISTKEIEDRETQQAKIVDELLEEKEIYDVASTLLKDDGVKAVIIQNYVPVINELINKFLSQMDLFVDFHINEEFQEVIRSRYRDAYSYESFSEGEKQRIDLAVLFTWRAIAHMRNTASTNLLVFDEILDSSLDDNGIDEFISIIKNLADNENVFVISHRGTSIADKFDRTLLFKKEQNFSKMMEHENA